MPDNLQFFPLAEKIARFIAEFFRSQRHNQEDRHLTPNVSILHADGPFTPIKNQTTFSACFSKQKTTFSRSPEDWLLKRSRVSDWSPPKKGSESPSLSDHRFSRSPLTGIRQRTVSFQRTHSNYSTCTFTQRPVFPLRKRKKAVWESLPCQQSAVFRKITVNR